MVDSRTAALAYGVTSRTIRRWVEDGRLINHGTRRRIRVDLDEGLRDKPQDVP